MLGLDFEDEQRKQAEALGVSLDAYRRMLRASLFGGATSAAQPQDNPDDPASEEEMANDVLYRGRQAVQFQVCINLQSVSVESCKVL